MLRGQHRGRHEHRHLGARADGLERGTQRHLRLAVTHVADDQPVHRSVLLKVGLDLVRGTKLVGRLLVGKGSFHLRLPG
jgi:hypothetical protein